MMYCGRYIMKIIQPKDKNQISDNLYIFYVNVTYDCNLKCSYCYNINRISKKSPKITGNIMKKISEAIYYNIKNNPVRFHLVGGEPTVNNDLVYIINNIFKSSLNIEKIKLFTNGLVLNKFIENLSNYDKNILEINVTYHAEQIKSLTFIKVIEYIKNYNVNLNIYILLNPEFIKEIDIVLNYLKKENINYIFTTLKNSYLSNELYKKYTQGNDKKIILNIMDNGSIIQELHELNLYPGIFYDMKCSYAKKVFCIDPNGEIYRACQSVKNKENKIYYAFFKTHVRDLLKNAKENCVCAERNELCNCDISYTYTKWKD